MDTFSVTADFAVDDTPAGENLAPRFERKPGHVWGMKLATPLAFLARGRIVVSIRDRQGNVTRIERTFKIDNLPPRPPDRLMEKR